MIIDRHVTGAARMKASLAITFLKRELRAAEERGEDLGNTIDRLKREQIDLTAEALPPSVPGRTGDVSWRRGGRRVGHVRNYSSAGSAPSV